MSRKISMLFVCLAAHFVLTSCGSSGGTPAPSPDQPPPTAPAPTPAPGSGPSWQTVAAVIQTNCAKCHDGVKEPAFTSGKVFKASAAKAELESGGMPKPPATISAADKATLLAYLGGP